MMENANPYYSYDDRSEKDRYLETWGYKLGSKEAEQAWSEKCLMTRKNAPMVMVDLAPYQSMIDGTMITSRSQHREHLKRNGCIEVGNETKHLKQAKVSPPPGLKEELIHQVYSKLRYK